MHRRGDSQNVACTHGTVQIAEAFKGKTIQQRKGSRHRSRDRQVIESRRRRSIERIFANPKAGIDRTVRAADDLSVAKHRFALLNRPESDLMRLRNRFANGEFGIVGCTRLESFRFHNDTGVI